MSALVSIITPTFNSEKYLSETIISIQNQSYTNWELLLVDDCSSDNSLKIAHQFAHQDSRISVFAFQENKGPAKARNFAIEKAKGNYLAFLDSDDIWFPNFISNNIQTIEKHNVTFVCSSYKRANAQLEIFYSDFIVPQKVTYKDILKTNSIGCLTAFIAIDKVGKKFMPLLNKRQDMGLWLSYLKEIPFVYGIQEPQAIYRIRNESISSNKFTLIKYQWEIYRKIEKLTLINSIYYLICWMYFGYLKHKN